MGLLSICAVACVSVFVNIGFIELKTVDQILFNDLCVLVIEVGILTSVGWFICI